MTKTWKKHKPYNEYPLRLCYTMHDCQICKGTILAGECYYDGGFGRRAHQECADKLLGSEAKNGKAS